MQTQQKHILIYCPVFLPEQSGYVHAFVQLINNLLSQQIKVDVLTPHEFAKQETLTHPLLRIYRYNPHLNIWAVGLFYKFKMLANYMLQLNKTNNYNMVMIETGDEPLLIGFLHKTILNKCTVRFHSTSDTEYLFIGKHKKYKLRKLFWRLFAAKRLQHICATNAYHLNFATTRVLIKKVSGSVLINAINNNELPHHKAKESLVFVMVGRMDAEGYTQKGYEQLLAVLPDIALQFKQYQAKLIIVGNGFWYSHIAAAVSSFDFVQLHQHMPHQQLMQLLSNAQVVLLPSLYEGVSMFALEALSRGNAVIYSKTGGLIDMVDGNGILIEPGNAKQLKAAMMEMLLHKNINTLMQQSIKIAEQKFNTDVQYKQFLAIYNTLAIE